MLDTVPEQGHVTYIGTKKHPIMYLDSINHRKVKRIKL
jgi:hypothetical protein